MEYSYEAKKVVLKSSISSGCCGSQCFLAINSAFCGWPPAVHGGQWLPRRLEQTGTARLEGETVKNAGTPRFGNLSKWFTKDFETENAERQMPASVQAGDMVGAPVPANPALLQDEPTKKSSMKRTLTRNPCTTVSWRRTWWIQPDHEGRSPQHLVKIVDAHHEASKQEGH